MMNTSAKVCKGIWVYKGNVQVTERQEGRQDTV